LVFYAQVFTGTMKFICQKFIASNISIVEKIADGYQT